MKYLGHDNRSHFETFNQVCYQGKIGSAEFVPG
jgi:hypothetical protein